MAKQSVAKTLSILALPLLAISLLANLIIYQRAKTVEKNYVVEAVIDGDSFILANQQRIRLFAVDAPELEFCGGQEAKAYLEQLILKKVVRIERVFIDSYQRVNAKVYLGNKLVNAAILKAGWARYDRSDQSPKQKMKTAYEAAQKSGKGIFGQCRQAENPERPECAVKGNLSQNDGEKTYHFPGCAKYEETIVEKDKGEEWFCTEREAQAAGYKRAAGCRDLKVKAF